MHQQVHTPKRCENDGANIEMMCAELQPLTALWGSQGIVVGNEEKCDDKRSGDMDVL